MHCLGRNLENKPYTVRYCPYLTIGLRSLSPPFTALARGYCRAMSPNTSGTCLAALRIVSRSFPSSQHVVSSPSVAPTNFHTRRNTSTSVDASVGARAAGSPCTCSPDSSGRTGIIFFSSDKYYYLCYLCTIARFIGINVLLGIAIFGLY